jgi:hypothetical protein
VRADALAVQLLTYGHTVAWVCDATTLPRRAVHRAGYAAGLTWHEESDTFRGRREQTPEVRALVAGMTAALDSVPDGSERRVLRREFARWAQRLDRALYPTTTDPLATTDPAPPAPKRRRARPRG